MLPIWWLPAPLIQYHCWECVYYRCLYNSNDDNWGCDEGSALITLWCCEFGSRRSDQLAISDLLAADVTWSNSRQVDWFNEVLKVIAIKLCSPTPQCRCQEDPVGLPSGRLEKTAGSSPHHVAQYHPTGSETSPSYAPQSSRFGSEPLSVEDDVDVWRYAIVSCMPETTTTTYSDDSHKRASVNNML